MYGRGVLCKRSRKSFHPRSIESLPKVDPLSCRLSESAFRKRACTVTKTLHITRNVASDTMKIENISLSDSKYCEIKDSSSLTRLPNLDNTWINSIIQFLIKQIIPFAFLSFYFFIVAFQRAPISGRTVFTDAFNQLYLRYMTIIVRKSFVAMKLSRIHVNWPDLL